MALSTNGRNTENTAPIIADNIIPNLLLSSFSIAADKLNSAPFIKKFTIATSSI